MNFTARPISPDEPEGVAPESPKRAPKKAPVSPFLRSLIVRTVIAVFAWQLALVTGGVIACERRDPGQCDAAWAQAEGAAKGIPATLLAWLADSPLR
jgi:hypothetical protein